ncbi:ISL3 family transposase [Armatimonas sp.]|uniref:ISL3 family transposase n=1 Tax=Armatimonas sp. TaxID=1872638 RepID=UPI00286D0532|nr:ISL3 family transposase [Armatimonas sp.]
MLESISQELEEQEIWHIRADDPFALTRVLNLPDMIVTGIEIEQTHQRVIVFCSHDFGVALCSQCNTISTKIHDYSRRCVRDMPWAARSCYIEFNARRFYCEKCKIPFREELQWLERCSRLTKRYQQSLFLQCHRTTLQAVHKKEKLGYKTLERLYYAQAQYQLRENPPTAIRKLGIDEFALKKGHNSFALALSDLEAGRIICVLPDRKKETLEAYFRTWSDLQRAHVTEAAMDLWEPYAQAVCAYLPNAKIVADRFHVMKNLNDAVTSARREIQRHLPEETKQTLKGCRWLLVRNHVDLSHADKEKLEAMFRRSCSLQQLHGFKEDFRALFEADLTPQEAKPKLEAWMSRVEASGLKALFKFVVTLKNRLEHILNYFHDRLTSGMVEGLNNKVKVIKRCAYGFGNFEHFMLRILMECDGST